mmetsp:Transcript_7839/g.18070  ORF Transcript_7839/g.18070 Transcript_7839/m.18070 type:complete len:205 (-) Transcript_7839:886-1500(-)
MANSTFFSGLIRFCTLVGSTESSNSSMSILTACPTLFVSYTTFSSLPFPETTTLGPLPQLPVQLQRVTLKVSGVSSVSHLTVALDPWFMHALSVQTLIIPPAVLRRLSCSSCDSAVHAIVLSAGGLLSLTDTSPSAATMASMVASNPCPLTILSLMARIWSPTWISPLASALPPSLSPETTTMPSPSAPSSSVMPRGLGSSTVV